MVHPELGTRSHDAGRPRPGGRPRRPVRRILGRTAGGAVRAVSGGRLKIRPQLSRHNLDLMNYPKRIRRRNRCERSGGAKTPVTSRSPKTFVTNTLRKEVSFHVPLGPLWTRTARKCYRKSVQGLDFRGLPFPRLKGRGPIEAPTAACRRLAAIGISTAERPWPH